MADEAQKAQENYHSKHTQENVGSPLELCVVIRHSRRGRPSNASGIHEVAYFAWNCSLLPEEDCRRAIAKYVDNMRAAGGAEADEADMQALTNDLYTLVEHKKKYYPTIRKLVVSAEVYDDGDNVRCRAVFLGPFDVHYGTTAKGNSDIAGKG